jgi:hypothetical protein
MGTQKLCSSGNDYSSGKKHLCTYLINMLRSYSADFSIHDLFLVVIVHEGLSKSQQRLHSSQYL